MSEEWLWSDGFEACIWRYVSRDIPSGMDANVVELQGGTGIGTTEKRSSSAAGGSPAASRGNGAAKRMSTPSLSLACPLDDGSGPSVSSGGFAAATSGGRTWAALPQEWGRSRHQGRRPRPVQFPNPPPTPPEVLPGWNRQHQDRAGRGATQSGDLRKVKAGHGEDLPRAAPRRRHSPMAMFRAAHGVLGLEHGLAEILELDGHRKPFPEGMDGTNAWHGLAPGILPNSSRQINRRRAFRRR